jgi:hypothetical protein
MKRILSIITLIKISFFIFSCNYPSSDYQSVFKFQGSGMKTSESFHLKGNDTKIVYKYNSPVEDLGAFGIYVLDKGYDFETEGGFPNLDVNKSESGEATIQKSKGEYYLHVLAYGDWEIEIQEKR